MGHRAPRGPRHGDGTSTRRRRRGISGRPRWSRRVAGRCRRAAGRGAAPDAGPGCVLPPSRRAHLRSLSALGTPGRSGAPRPREGSAAPSGPAAPARPGNKGQRRGRGGQRSTAPSPEAAAARGPGSAAPVCATAPRCPRPLPPAPRRAVQCRGAARLPDPRGSWRSPRPQLEGATEPPPPPPGGRRRCAGRGGPGPAAGRVGARRGGARRGRGRRFPAGEAVPGGARASGGEPGNRAERAVDNGRDSAPGRARCPRGPNASILLAPAGPTPARRPRAAAGGGGARR